MSASLAFLTLLLSATSATQADELPLPALVIGRAASAIEIDGKLTERGWREAAQIPVLQDWETGEAVGPETQVRACWDKEKLYVVYVCHEPQIDKIIARPNGDVWNDDEVELFVQPPGQFAYYHFMVNALGRLQCEKTRGGAYTTSAKTAAVREEERWIVELAVSWEDLGGPPVAGQTWRMNFNRVRKPSPSSFGVWSVTEGPFHNPARFGFVRFEQSAPCLVARLAPGAGLLGANRFEASGSATGSPDAEIAARLGTKVIAKAPLRSTGPWRFEAPYALVLESPAAVSFQIATKTGVLYDQSFPLRIKGNETLLAVKEAARQAERMAGLARLPESLRAGLRAQTGAARRVLKRAMDEVRKAVEEKRTVPAERWSALLTEAQRVANTVNSPLVWTRNPFFTTKPSSLPSALQKEVELHVEAVENERETGALLLSNLYSGKALEVRASVSALEAVPGVKSASADQAPLESDRATLAEAAMIRSATRGRLADPLVPLDEAGRLFVPPGETRELWLTVDTFDAPPGLYRGTLRLQPFDPTAQAWTVEVPVAVRIWPLKLAKALPIKVFNFDYGRGGRSEAWLRDLLQHRVNVFALHVPVPDQNGVADFSVLDEPLQRVSPYGVIFFESWFFRAKGWQPQHERWVKDLVAYMTSKGLDYDDWVLHIFDETLSDLFLETAKAIKQVDPRLHLFSDMMGTPQRVAQFAPYVDYWCPHYGALAKPGLQRMRATGHPIWTYDCGSGKAVAPTHNRALPWCAWHYKLDGVSYWTYYSSYGDPWNDFDFNHPDWSKVYVGTSGSPVSSKRWEAWREGLEDWALFHLYTKTSNQKGGPTDTDKKLLGEIDAIGMASNAPADELEDVSTRVIHRLLHLHGIRETAFPPYCLIAWGSRVAGDGQGRIQQIPADPDGPSRQTGAGLRSATSRSWTFLIQRVDAKPGDKVILRLRAKGTGSLKAGLCEGFHWGGDGAGHRTTTRNFSLTPTWTRIQLEHTVQELPVEAIVGFDYGNDKSSAELRDYDAEVVAAG